MEITTTTWKEENQDCHARAMCCRRGRAKSRRRLQEYEAELVGNVNRVSRANLDWKIMTFQKEHVKEKKKCRPQPAIRLPSPRHNQTEQMESPDTTPPIMEITGADGGKHISHPLENTPTSQRFGPHAEREDTRKPGVPAGRKATDAELIPSCIRHWPVKLAVRREPG